MIKSIKVVPYNPEWTNQFEAEAKLIKEVLGKNCVDIHHVGSTSVIGLSAKPKIDIIAVIKDTTVVIERLESIGYQYRGEFNIPFHLGFSKRVGTSVNLHVYEEDNPEIELNILFRDYLRNHPLALAEYAKLKYNLIAQESSHQKENSIFTGYTLGKDDFIKKILQKAGFNRMMLRHCTHIEEWKMARLLRQKYFFDTVPISDPYTWTFTHNDHMHFVFYQGTQMIGYAHLVRWPQHRAAMRIIVIDEPYRNQGFGGQFLTLCERWLRQQSFLVLQLEASPKAKAFYLKQGYSEMPFNDPDGYKTDPRDTAMGKLL